MLLICCIHLYLFCEVPIALPASTGGGGGRNGRADYEREWEMVEDMGGQITKKNENGKLEN